MINVLDCWGRPVQLEAGLMASLVPSSRTINVLFGPSSFVTNDDGTTANIPIPPDRLLAMLVADAPIGDTYTPTMASGGAGVLSLISARWQRVNDIVTVHLKFNFAPAVAGTPELISCSLPTGVNAPTAVFAAAADAWGIVSEGVAAADFVDIQVRARAAGRLVEFSLDQTTASALHAAVICYKI